MLDSLEALGSSIWNAIQTQTPKAVVGFAILFVGWIAARIIQKGFAVLFKKLGMDRAVSEKTEARLSETASRAVFYLVMLFVALLFFNYVELTIVAEPLAALFHKIMYLLPNVGVAVILSVVAYGLARIARTFFLTLGRKTRLDEWFARIGVKPEAGRKTPVQWASDLLFFLVLLLFLPAVLGYLKIEALQAPLQHLLDRFLGFVLNLAGSLLIVAVAWLIGSLARPFVVSILSTLKIDEGARAIGLKTEGRSRPSQWLGDAAFVLVILVSLPAALANLSLPTLADPIADIFRRIFGYLPSLAAAVVLLIVSWIVGRVIAGLVERFLGTIRFDALFRNMGLEGISQPNELVMKTGGKLTWIVIVLLGSLEALDLLKFEALSMLLLKCIYFIPPALGAVIIVGAGLYLGKFVGDLVARSSEGLGATQSKVLSRLCYIAIVVFAVSVALEQLSLGTETVTALIKIVAAGLAVAFALAVGLGGKDLVADYLNDWKKRHKGS